MSKVDGSALTGVSETALMTLLVRAKEARRPDSIIDDPVAIKLVDEIDYDWAKFGFTRRQDMALRALTFDTYTRRYLVDHPSATVVALARGPADVPAARRGPRPDPNAPSAFLAGNDVRPAAGVVRLVDSPRRAPRCAIGSSTR